MGQEEKLIEELDKAKNCRIEKIDKINKESGKDFPTSSQGPNRSGKMSVHKPNCTLRLDMAKQQFEMAKSQKEMKGIKDIENLVNEFLDELDLDRVDNPIRELKDEVLNAKFYKDLFCHEMGDCRDIVWIKFTQEGHVGVVAKGADINFCYPPNEFRYHDKEVMSSGREVPVYNTSGIIIHRLGLRWNTDKVLVFPLTGKGMKALRGKFEAKGLGQGTSSGKIETGIGDYLITKGVPILDFYSHM